MEGEVAALLPVLPVSRIPYHGTAIFLDSFGFPPKFSIADIAGNGLFLVP